MNNANCPQCSKELSVDRDINLDTGLGKCGDCNIFFELDGESRGFSFNKSKYVNPNSITTRRDHNGFIISFKWKKSFFMLFFAGFWNLITYTVLGAFFIKGDKGFFSSPAAILAITHPTVGFVTGYYALCSLINTTTIKIGFRQIEVKSTPLPWPFLSKKIPANDIDQLYVKMYVSHRQNNVRVYKYQVMARSSKEDFSLVKGIDTYEKAVSIENEIELALGIKDERVQEEHIPA